MAETEPIAFLSYVRADDEHEHGRISKLRARLEGEVKMHTGKLFKIYQDKRDLKWGQQWKERLDSTLLNVTFLIPIVTPSYFQSTPCRDEFEKFILREKQLGENQLILPIYYLEVDEIGYLDHGDPIAKILASRNWSDWRELRFKPIDSPEIEYAISDMAHTIKIAMRELEGIITASRVKTPSLLSTIEPKKIDVSKFSPDILTFKQLNVDLDHVRTEPNYYVYTTIFDEVIPAKDLSSDEELTRLYRIISKNNSALKRVYRRQIQDVMTYLSAARAKETSITFLVDNSGSMRDGKIIDASSWMTILCEILESAAISVEVLGYTTRAWKGGQSREAWLKHGKPANPGRLNDVRHIVYKDFSSSIKESRKNFGLMARQGLLKENIDGEALIWAYKRSIGFAKKRKLIVVVNDGAPVDDSTLSVNRGDFLDQHLLTTITWIEKQSVVELYGIGIGDEINRYYKNNISVKHSDTIGTEVFSALQKWIG